MLGRALHKLGEFQPARAARLLAAADAIRAAIQAPILPAKRPEYDQLVAAVRLALGETAFAKAWAIGRLMPPEQVVEFAMK